MIKENGITKNTDLVTRELVKKTVLSLTPEQIEKAKKNKEEKARLAKIEKLKQEEEELRKEKGEIDKAIAELKKQIEALPDEANISEEKKVPEETILTIKKDIDWKDLANSVKYIAGENINSQKKLDEYISLLKKSIKELSKNESFKAFLDEKQKVLDDLLLYIKNNAGSSETLKNEENKMADRV